MYNQMFNKYLKYIEQVFEKMLVTYNKMLNKYLKKMLIMYIRMQNEKQKETKNEKKETRRKKNERMKERMQNEKIMKNTKRQKRKEKNGEHHLYMLHLCCIYHLNTNCTVALWLVARCLYRRQPGIDPAYSSNRICLRARP